MKLIDFNPKLLVRPSRYEPDWFKISSSMGDSYSACREKFVWQYVHKIREEKTDHKLLRRSCVIFATREDLIKKFPDTSISDRVLYFLKSEAKDIMQSLGKTWITTEKAAKDLDVNPVEMALHLRYSFPPAENKRYYFTFDEFIKQCIAASRTIRQLLEKEKIQPIKVNGVMLVQKTLDAPLIANGEILDEIHGKPTIMRAQVNYVDVDQNVYIWRISSKRSSEKDMVAMISEVVDNQCAVISHHLGNDVDFPMKVNLIKIVVKKTGEISEVESHIRLVSEQEVIETKQRMAIKSRDIREMRLFKERSWTCPRCNYYNVCILGKSEGFKKVIYNEADELVAVKTPEQRSEEDTLPF